MHNRLDITSQLPTKVSHYHGRPFLVIHGETFVKAIREQIQDDRVRRISTNIGGVDVFSTSADLLEATQLRKWLKSLYT
jgi:spore coat polysaccharide biosynthesis predicted glycosyltransferase SpsG